MIDNEFSGKVKRYDMSCDDLHGGVEHEAADGRWIESSDFDRVADERNSLRQQLDALELSRRSWMDEAKSLEVRLSSLETSSPEVEPDSVCMSDDGCPTEGAVLKRFWRAHQPDKGLCDFYEADDYPSLVRELVGHVAQLQDAAKRNVKPWEDTFPPTLLPAHVERVNAANQAAKPDLAESLESLAKQIYQSWESKPGYVPWVEGRTSAKQEEARQIASRTFELALANQVEGRP